LLCLLRGNLLQRLLWFQYLRLNLLWVLLEWKEKLLRWLWEGMIVVHRVVVEVVLMVDLV
jgi:hypothetical protein